MDYAFFDRDDEDLIRLSDMPVQGGIAVAMRTTGYAPKDDEIVELAITDLEGRVLFDERVKPQNVEDWPASAASGGISCADVAEARELFQFEDDIIKLFDEASVVVFEHVAFGRALIENSWISLPATDAFDLVEEFRLSHCAEDYASEPLSATALVNIAGYYGLPEADTSAAGECAMLARCYRELVAECACERKAKGQAYWDERDRRLAEQAKLDEGQNAAARLREKRLSQMNALLWVSGAIIFASLVIQLAQRGGDSGFMIVAGAASAFCLIRGIVNFRR